MDNHPRTILHLSGGLRAEFPCDGRFNIWPIPGYGGFEITKMPDNEYISTIHGFGLSWIGIDEIDHMDGLDIRIWTDFTYNHIPQLSESHVADNISSYWSGISYSYKLDGKGTQSELAEKISFHLRASSIRLRDISDAYGKQLVYACNRKMKSFNEFTNFEVYTLILSAHSFLLEICALRDYISLFSSEFIFGFKPQQQMWRLAKQLKENPVLHPLKNFIVEATDENGVDPWLFHLTEYRNYITHAAPLHHATKSTNIKVIELKHPYDHDMIAVTFKIPWNVKDKSNEAKECDLLIRFHQLLIMMQKLCFETAGAAGIEPKFFQIGPEDILDLKKV